VQRVRIFVLRPAISAAKSSTAACQIHNLVSQSKSNLGTFLFVFERSAAKDRIYQQEVCASAAVSYKQKQNNISFHCSTVPCPIPPASSLCCACW
jgi:hypothetical protein